MPDSAVQAIISADRIDGDAGVVPGRFYDAESVPDPLRLTVVVVFLKWAEKPADIRRV